MAVEKALRSRWRPVSMRSDVSQSPEKRTSALRSPPARRLDTVTNTMEARRITARTLTLMSATLRQPANRRAREAFFCFRRNNMERERERGFPVQVSSAKMHRNSLAAGEGTLLNYQGHPCMSRRLVFKMREGASERRMLHSHLTRATSCGYLPLAVGRGRLRIAFFSACRTPHCFSLVT